jgi:predicted lipid-binding transport protein (Tim44 family)
LRSEDEEFLAGAKAVYARIREAMEKGDVSGMAPFVAPEFMGELARMATARAAQTGGKTSQLLLIEAAIESRASAGGLTRIDTRYEVLAKLPGSSGDGREREVWTFVRDESAPGAMWLLAGIRAA